jgi:hypothetical protein
MSVPAVSIFHHDRDTVSNLFLLHPFACANIMMSNGRSRIVSTTGEIDKEGEKMGEIVHTSRIKIVREKGPTRRAMIEGFNEPIYYGVHGGIKRFYKIEPEKEHAATLDHIVAATAA